MKIVFASHNHGKIQEVKALLATFSIDVVTSLDLAINDIEETGMTFVENALIKARHAATISGLPALADDSGLIVGALNGAPGLYSARYAGETANAEQNIEKLLREMQDVPDDKREAAFHCTMVFLLHALDPAPLICEGNWYGKIMHHPSGEKGFGYDPVFYDSERDCSAAELPIDQKNKMSHRGQAIQCLLKKLPEKICWHSQ